MVSHNWSLDFLSVAGVMGKL